MLLLLVVKVEKLNVVWQNGIWHCDTVGLKIRRLCYSLIF